MWRSSFWKSFHFEMSQCKLINIIVELPLINFLLIKGNLYATFPSYFTNLQKINLLFIYIHLKCYEKLNMKFLKIRHFLEYWKNSLSPSFFSWRIERRTIFVLSFSIRCNRMFHCWVAVPNIVKSASSARSLATVIWREPCFRHDMVINLVRRPGIEPLSPMWQASSLSPKVL